MSDPVFYLTQEQIQEEVNALYAESGQKQNLYQAILNCYNRGVRADPLESKRQIEKLRTCSEDEFVKNYRKVAIEMQLPGVKYRVQDPYAMRPPVLIPAHNRIVDVFVENIYYHVLTHTHSHENLFEIVYVYDGTCHFLYDGDDQLLETGDFCIIGPDTMHEVVLDGENDHIIQLFICYDHFRTSFINLLEDDSIVSDFFKLILANKNRGRYLRFSTQKNPFIRQIARNLYTEQFTYDEYSPSCTLYWMQLLFSYALRVGIHDYHVSGDAVGIDFAPILDYVQAHYKTATLSDVAAHFHYSVSYLSSSIKQITGDSYSSIVKKMKMREAADCLLFTDKSIEDISAQVGYNSADHFSRVFRSYYDVSPSVYRKNTARTPVRRPKDIAEAPAGWAKDSAGAPSISRKSFSGNMDSL